MPHGEIRFSPASETVTGEPTSVGGIGAAGLLPPGGEIPAFDFPDVRPKDHAGVDRGPAAAPAAMPETQVGMSVCVVVPAFNEGRSVARVVARIRSAVPDAHVVVVNDGSHDDTGVQAGHAGATVVTLPVNLGIGGAVQAGYRYAMRRSFDIAVQVDGDDQHDPSEIGRLLRPILEGQADMTVGSRWLGRGDYVAARTRRRAMNVLAALVRWRTGGAFTDTTSGFRAVGVRGIALFAETYPTDFPEVESLVLATRHGLRIQEVPVQMTARFHGRSSISGLRSAYFMARVTMGLLVGGLNLNGVDREETT